MMSVLWSDCNNIIVYRTFEEFKKLSRDLRKRFPIEAGFLKRSERVLPKFKDAPFLFRRSNRDMERLKLLEVYSRDLLQTDANVSQCEDVTQFFMPQTCDFNPSFHEDSVVIMPSDAGDVRKKASRLQTETAITQRIQSDRYQCVEAYEGKDTKSRPFKVNQGDFLGVLLKDTTGWWLVENDEKRLAWFPAPYLQKTGSTDDLQAVRESVHGGALYFAEKGYEAKSSDEISVDVSVVVEVVEKSDNGWWLVWYNGRAGYIPSMYLRPYTNPHQRFQDVLNKGIYASTPDIHAASRNLNVAAAPNQRAVEDDPSQNSAASKRQEERRMALSRRKSRSLSGLPTNGGQEHISPLGLELNMLQGDVGGARGRNPNANLKPVPCPRKLIKADWELPLMSKGSLIARAPAIRKLPRELSQPRKNSGSEDSSSMSGSDPFLYSANVNSDSNIPVVPPRPQAQEILQKCTTVTKKAVQKTGQQRLVL
ncbi:NADPH oxidase organizer 1 isoform X2 [Ambystoma mexicanum]